MARKRKPRPAHLDDAGWQDFLDRMQGPGGTESERTGSEADPEDAERAPGKPRASSEPPKRPPPATEPSPPVRPLRDQGRPEALDDAAWNAFIDTVKGRGPVASPDPEPKAEDLAEPAPAAPRSRSRPQRKRRRELDFLAVVDLHGLDRKRSEQRLVSEVRRALTTGGVLLVVHGRGLHSGERGPVLKEWLRSWAARAPGGPHRVEPAKPEHGGFGASYLFIER